MVKLAVFGCLEIYLSTLFCFELRKSQKSHCDIATITKYRKDSYRIDLSGTPCTKFYVNEDTYLLGLRYMSLWLFLVTSGL